MKQLPSLNSRKVVQALKKFGFQEDRQRGSHLVMINQETKKRTVVPMHSGQTIKKPLLKSIIEDDAGITIEKFLEEL